MASDLVGADPHQWARKVTGPWPHHHHPISTTPSSPRPHHHHAPISKKQVMTFPAPALTVAQGRTPVTSTLTLIPYSSPRSLRSCVDQSFFFPAENARASWVKHDSEWRAQSFTQSWTFSTFANQKKTSNVLFVPQCKYAYVLIELIVCVHLLKGHCVMF